MDDAIRRSVERQFPELSGGYHLPRFARVVAVADAPSGAGICDDFRPRYAVDIQVLLPDGEPDPDLPMLAGVPLPLPTGGEEMGIFAFPEEGTQVVVCFAYGLPHKPYIQTILPHGLSMPKVPKGDQVWQHSEACQQRVDADGNWLRQTDGKIKDKAIEREVEALDNTESFQNHTRTVDDHSTESVGGIKKIEALGALKLLSGGSASLAAASVSMVEASAEKPSFESSCTVMRFWKSASPRLEQVAVILKTPLHPTALVLMVTLGWPL